MARRTLRSWFGFKAGCCITSIPPTTERRFPSARSIATRRSVSIGRRTSSYICRTDTAAKERSPAVKRIPERVFRNLIDLGLGEAKLRCRELVLPVERGPKDPGVVRVQRNGHASIIETSHGMIL